MTASASETRTFEVHGMSCSHCEVAVSDSVTALDGVAEATADATAGTLTVSGRFDDRSIAEAVHAVGYELKR